VRIFLSNKTLSQGSGLSRTAWLTGLYLYTTALISVKQKSFSFTCEAIYFTDFKFSHILVLSPDPVVFKRTSGLSEGECLTYLQRELYRASPSMLF